MLLKFTLLERKKLNRMKSQVESHSHIEIVELHVYNIPIRILIIIIT